MACVNGENEEAFQDNPKWIIQINNPEKDCIFCFMIWLKSCKSSEVVFLCMGRNLKSFKFTRSTWFSFMGQFGLPTPTVLCDVWSLSLHLNMNIGKSENPFQKCWHSDSFFWYHQNGLPVAEMLKSLTKFGATNYVNWNKLLNSEPWTLVFPPHFLLNCSLLSPQGVWGICIPPCTHWIHEVGEQNLRIPTYAF